METNQKLSFEELLKQALLIEGDKPYEIPSNWMWVRLGLAIKNSYSGFACSKSKELAQSDKSAYPHLRPNNIGFDNKLNMDKIVYIPYHTVAEKYKIINKNEILFNNTNSTELVGRAVIVKEDMEMAFSNHITKLTEEHTLVKPDWIVYSLNKLWQDGVFAKLSKKWVGQSGINQQDLKEQFYIPVPPLAEQQRIVNLIDSLFERLNRAKELIEEALDSFENRWAAILHKAFTGEFTAKWREENRVDFNSEWEEKEFSDCVLYMQNGISKRGSTSGIDTVVIRLANLFGNNICEDDLRYIKLDEKEIERYLIRENDILIIRVNGSRDNVGKMILINNCKQWTYCDHIIRASINNNIVQPKYIAYFSWTNAYKTHIQKNIVSSAGQNTISQKSLSVLPIPVPPLQEQKEIVRILDNLFENDQKARELCDLSENIDLMKKSILARAFRGKLNTNDPEEESALDLLKEILWEKEEV